VPDRRERLLEAMVHVAARHGYGGASVARVVERAGVSRATFYEHFGDREDCFLAAYRKAVGDWHRDIHAAARLSSPGDRPRAAIDAVLERVAAEPAAARVVLVEALAAGPAVRAEHDRQIDALERSIEGFLSRDQRLQITATALLGGVAGTISMQVVGGEAESLPALREDLLAWVDAHALHGEAVRWSEDRWRQMVAWLPGPHPSPRPESAGLLPRGRGALPEADAAKLRHSRILLATARATAERGYAEMTVADIVATARVTRGAFYSHFRNKEAAFLAAQALALQESIGIAASAFFASSEWPERVWGASAGLLGYVASHPDLAWLGIVEAHAVGASAINRQHDARSAYAVFLEEGYRAAEGDGRSVPRVASDAIAWAVFALLRREVVKGRTSRIVETLPQVVYVILAPFIGPRRAMDFVSAQARSGGRERPAGQARPRLPVDRG
jgi:AcrR family transcriptional regulator